MEMKSNESQNLVGKVFSTTKSGHSFDAFQIVKVTTKFVKARRIPCISKHDLLTSTHKIDWKWTKENPINPKEKKLDQFSFSEIEGKYFLHKGKGTATLFLGETTETMDETFSTVEY